MIKYLGKELSPTEMKLLRWNKKLNFLEAEYDDVPMSCPYAYRLQGKIEVIKQVIAELSMELSLEENPNLLPDIIRDFKNSTN